MRVRALFHLPRTDVLLTALQGSLDWIGSRKTHRGILRWVQHDTRCPSGCVHAPIPIHSRRDGVHNDHYVHDGLVLVHPDPSDARSEILGIDGEYRTEPTPGLYQEHAVPLCIRSCVGSHHTHFFHRFSRPGSALHCAYLPSPPGDTQRPYLFELFLFVQEPSIIC